MTDDDLVFKALADRTRRALLDALFVKDGQSQSELEEIVQQHTTMTRFGVAKHLRLLEEANLVTSRKQGRTKHHFLNAVPIRAIHNRPRSSAVCTVTPVMSPMTCGPGAPISTGPVRR